MYWIGAEEGARALPSHNQSISVAISTKKVFEFL